MKPWIVTLLFAALAGSFALAGDVVAQDDAKELDQRIEAADVTDPDQLYEVAVWAVQSKNGKVRKEGRKLLEEVIELDVDHAKARAALNHVKVGDVWYESKEKAEKAKLELLAEEMEAKGFVKFRDGFIHKDRKRDWERNWERGDDLIWRSFEESMKLKGYIQYKGEWLKVSPSDLERSERHRKMTGDDMIVMTTEHFRLHAMIPPKLAQHYAEQLERCLDWYFETFRAGEVITKEQLFPGRPDIWCFNSFQQSQDWVTAYSEEYRFDAEDKKRFRERPAGHLIAGKLIATVVAEKSEDLENPMLHEVAFMMNVYYTSNNSPDWLNEAVGHWAEAELSKEKYGRVNMSTQARYGNGGGIAGKEFNTKDMPPMARGLVKRGEEIDVIQLSRLGLNALNADHLAQGDSHFEWMYNQKRDQLVKLGVYLRNYVLRGKLAEPDQRYMRIMADAIPGSFDVPVEEWMDAWRKHVTDTYR